ncbi:hypothetical protein SpCBS45565_g00357 [Spizellomyces sp. 'palustris']|nr:hypothetical protein SpCBS45565_g00357 [Spizellomyces sp. 'palustris']
MEIFEYERLIQEFETIVHANWKQNSESGDRLHNAVFNKQEQSSDSSTPNPPFSTTCAERSPRRLSRLLVFDFDSTLFRSPLPNPALWSDELRGALISDCGWFAEPRTLHPPFIPECPGDDWWDTETIRDVQKACAYKEETVTVLLTGRRHDLFGERIKRMCEMHNPPLTFDLFFFREGYDPTSILHHPTTLDFKLAVLHRLLSTFPSISQIEFYDDRKKHLDLFAKELEKLRFNGRISSYFVHHVVHAPVEARYMPADWERALVSDLVSRCNCRILAARRRQEEAYAAEGKGNGGTVSGRSFPCKMQRRSSASIFRNTLELTDQIAYTEIKIDANDVQALRAKYPPPTAKWEVRADHVTVCLGPAKAELVEPMGGVGARVSIRVTAVGELQDKVTAVKVEAVPGGVLLSDNAIPHITLAVAPVGRARESNLIVTWRALDQPFVVSGTIMEKVVTGLKMERNPSQLPKRDVSIGSLIKKHHSQLRGRDIGAAVSLVEEWMGKTFIENLGQNAAVIEWYIQGLDLSTIRDGGTVNSSSVLMVDRQEEN